MLQTIILEKQNAEPIDDATMAAIQIGLDQLERGETVTLEQSNINLKNRIQAWRKIQKEILPV